MKFQVFRWVAAAVLLSLVGCGENNNNESAGKDEGSKPVVFATNYPLAYFAEQIGGNTADVQFPEIDGDPAFWHPNDDQVTAMQGSALILTNGASYEKWAKTVSLPATKTVDTSAAFADRFIVIADATTHSHGDEGEHSHAGTAFTTWMDFDQARQQAEAVRDAMTKAMPDEADTLRANAQTLLANIAKLHEDMQGVTSVTGDRPLVASHPVYQYFAIRPASEDRSNGV
ncbi:MAG: zinc ABC transporter substrate-binding protein [Planctomycetota bacterium]